MELNMQIVINEVKNAPKSAPLITKIDTSQVELQRQIDKLNSNILKGKEHDKINARIEKINEDIALVRTEHEIEREAMKTWGMAPKTWKYIGGGATIFSVIADVSSIASNIPLTILVDNTTIPIIVTTTITGSIGLIAASILGVFTYGQYKVEKRLDAFDLKVRQNELISIFLNAYQEFMDNHPDSNASKDTNLDTQIDELKKCVELLKNISVTSVPQEAKDLLLSTMIDKLPDEDERKKKLVEQKNLAEKIEKRKTNIKDSLIHDASSEQAGFLKTARADQAFDSNSNMILTDPLREKYNANLQSLREEFGMDIQEMHVNGYKLMADASIKKLKKKENKGDVVIDLTI